MSLVTPELLAACNNEPIHRPGAIHPHGFLLTCDHTGVIVQATANGSDWWGLPSETLIGLPLGRLLPASLASAVLALPMTDGAVRHQRIPCPPMTTPAFGTVAPLCTAIRTPRVIIVEWELVESASPDTGPHYAGAISALAACDEIPGLCATACGILAPVLDYDRVMVYSFLPGGEGSVVGESIRAGLEPFLGLHYPASDIPEQARALYLSNQLRVLADADGEPVPLLPNEPPDGQGPLDLGQSPLRAHSPMYREYIRNMGSRASLVTSIIVNRRLWGLVICNHRSPRRPGAALRDFAAAVTTMLAARLGELERTRGLERQHAATVIVERVAQMVAVDPERHWIEPLSEQANALLNLLGATGFALVTPERVLSLRAAPPPVVIRAALAAGGPGLIHDGSNRAIAAALGQTACGMLAVPLGRGISLCWFRPEHAHEVTWGGDLSELSKSLSIRADGVPVFTPRRSFAAWTQQVRGLCRPWSVDDRTAADTLARGLANSVLLLAR